MRRPRARPPRPATSSSSWRAIPRRVPCRRPPTSSAICASRFSSTRRPAAPTSSRCGAAPAVSSARWRAAAWEAERDFARAAEAYGALVKDLDPRSFLFEDALMDQARALELAGRKPEAVAAYQRLLKDLPTARRADEVRIRLATLGTAAR